MTEHDPQETTTMPNAEADPVDIGAAAITARQDQTHPCSSDPRADLIAALTVLAAAGWHLVQFQDYPGRDRPFRPWEVSEVAEVWEP